MWEETLWDTTIPIDFALNFYLNILFLIFNLALHDIRYIYTGQCVMLEEMSLEKGLRSFHRGGRIPLRISRVLGMHDDKELQHKQNKSIGRGLLRKDIHIKGEMWSFLRVRSSFLG